MARRLEGYGIVADDVSLQEMKLPDQIVNECIEACRALAAKEVAGVAPAYALSDFLSQYLKKRMGGVSAGTSDGGIQRALTAAAVAGEQKAGPSAHGRSHKG